MSRNQFVLRRDTQKHTPPRPGVHPHPVTPPPVPHPRHEDRDAPDFWKEEERRHAHPPPPVEEPPGSRRGGHHARGFHGGPRAVRMLMAAATAGCLAAAPVSAQVVHGRVVARGGDGAVAAALVRLQPQQAGDSVSVRADSLGRFTLRAPAAGDYRIAASRVGYREAVSPRFALQRGDSLEVVFRLATDTVLLNPLQVVASSRRRPAQVQEFYQRAARNAFGWFVTREEIDRRPRLRTTDLLWTAPGIHPVPGRGAGYVLRGRGGCIPAVYLDGMRIGAGAVDLWTSPESLEGIEVYSGPEAPAQYGGAAGGCAVVLLWTRT